MAQTGKQQHRDLRIIKRNYAERYILVALISFAGSVTITRLFLSLTGYPQIGGGELHIAHVLWGGLLLFIAALLPLLFANNWVYTIGAILGGVGVGLFMDEVGKFITTKNDYFFPAAAPIIYVFFLFTVLVFIQIKTMREANRYADLHRALDKVHDILEQPGNKREKSQLREQIKFLVEYEPPGKKQDLVMAIRDFLEDDDEDEPDAGQKAAPLKETSVRVTRDAWRFLQKNMRTLLIIGTIAIGLLNLKNPVSEFFGQSLPSEIVAMLDIHGGRQIDPQEAVNLYRFRVMAETVVGVLMILSAVVLSTRHKFIGAVMGCVSFLLCLMVVDLLLFYFEQFSTIATTSIQFILLIGYLYYLTQLGSKAGKKLISAGMPAP